jgi:GDP/UDP-N,N'-diacetylbacillosamine 2-epimerase (hydrolysing)
VRRTVCVVTGTRAEYGLLRWVIQGIADAPELTLQIVATGMHLSPEFGLTYREIERDGFRIDRKVEMLLSSDSSVGVGKSIGLGTIGFADALNDLRPELIVVLGDRFEILAAVSAALAARIPVAHLHGGEATEGAIDEAIRHAVTKMSHLHFVAAEEFRQRVIQLGEAPECVFLVGGLGIDSIRRHQMVERVELEQMLDFELGPKNLLVTFHPATLDAGSAVEQMGELLTALEGLDETHLIFTLPNADMESRELISMIRTFVARHPHAKAYTSLGQSRYLSTIAHVDGVIGNSSSGLIEAPAFRKGTIDIGDRQRGRPKASSVIDCAPNRDSISAALQKLYSPDFQASLAHVRNPYGEGGASQRVVEVLATVSLDGILKKKFHAL